MMLLPSIVKVVEWHDYPPAVGKPSCLQTTIASLISQKVSHTVPHAPLEHSSTRPSIVVVPFTSLKSPVTQGVPDAGRKENSLQIKVAIHLIAQLERRFYMLYPDVD